MSKRFPYFTCEEVLVPLQWPLHLSIYMSGTTFISKWVINVEPPIAPVFTCTPVFTCIQIDFKTA